ncbi:hypothetical protein B0T10DRAFT_498121, partial [Thelonectria olida]
MVTSERGRGNASLAIDLHIRALATASNTSLLRRHLHKRKCIGRRWRDLSHPATLLLVIYSEPVETVVRSPLKIDKPTFKVLASIALASIPPRVLTVCVQLAEVEKAF